MSWALCNIVIRFHLQRMQFVLVFVCLFFFFKQKTAYEMRISDWSSDVCSSDLSYNDFKRNALSDWSGAPFEILLQNTVGRIKSFAQELHVEGEEIGRASCRERVCQYV